MAYLIECDRCGETEAVKDTCANSTVGWAQLPGFTVGSSMRSATLKGGELCPSCVKALVKWREPIPRCEPPDYGAFKKRA